MIVFVDGRPWIMCDGCYMRTPLSYWGQPEDPMTINEHHCDQCKREHGKPASKPTSMTLSALRRMTPRLPF